jgi:hypothetical protein
MTYNDLFQIKQFLYNIFFCAKNHAVYVMIWKNIAEPDRPQMAI